MLSGPPDDQLDAAHLDQIEAENDRLRAELSMGGPPPFPPGMGSPQDAMVLQQRLALVEAELGQACRERDMYAAQRGGSPALGGPVDRERLVVQVEQERETHSAQVAELELSLARKVG